MRILYLVGREISYPRNDVILRAFLRFSEVEVISGGDKGSLILRSVKVLVQALPHLASRDYDLIYVGFYGHLLMLLVGLISPVPVLFDAFVSNFDTLCFDRQLYSPDSIIGNLAFWLDKVSCRLADRILLDTLLHAEFFQQTFDIPEDKIISIPVGCNEDQFHPRDHETNQVMTKALYYSTYLPLHGVDVVVQAAGRLRDVDRLRFKIIGEGQEYHAVQSLAQRLNLTNVTFKAFIPIEQLPDEISGANVCLGGHFGKSDKACRVVPGKIYQIMAMSRPVIAANTPAIRALLTHGENALLCSPDDPISLAEAILELHEDPDLGARIARNGRKRFLEVAGEAVITEILREVIGSMLEIS